MCVYVYVCEGAEDGQRERARTLCMDIQAEYPCVIQSGLEFEIILLTPTSLELRF